MTFVLFSHRMTKDFANYVNFADFLVNILSLTGINIDIV